MSENDRSEREETVADAAEGATAGAETGHRESSPAYSDAQLRRRRQARRQVEAAFAACVRCGYFLSDYRLLVGQSAYEDMIGEDPGEWLFLAWSPQLHYLLEKTYGVRLDADLYLFKGSCPACSRPYEVDYGDESGVSVRIAVNHSRAPRR